MERLIQKLARWITTLGPVGYLPAAGTWGSMAALPLVVLFDRLPLSYDLKTLLIIVSIFVVMWIVRQALFTFMQEDPSEIVLDEVLGMFIVFLGLPLTPHALIIGFCFFRVFDSIKPFGISYVEELPREWGIVADDILAGIYAHLALVLILTCMSQ